MLEASDESDVDGEKTNVWVLKSIKQNGHMNDERRVAQAVYNIFKM